jgi:hypothetical protein
MIGMYFISLILIRLVPRRDAIPIFIQVRRTYVMVCLLLQNHYPMLFKVIATIVVTVPVFVLGAQTPNPMGGSDGIAIPLTRRSDTDAREFHATSHNA